jgi:tRNA (Thr-GGU) A37 N-methylase
LEKLSGRFLEILGNDMLDQTPVIDIKPYVPVLDAKETEKIGWYKDRLFTLPTARSDSRMSD